MSDHDPLDFVERALIARGALCERAGARLDAILPADTGRHLELGELASLSIEPDADTVFAGFGGRLLEQLVAEEVGKVRFAAAAVGEPERRRATPDATAAFSCLNGVLKANNPSIAGSRVLLFQVSWRAECDEVEEGLYVVAVGPSGAPIDGYTRLLALGELSEGADPTVALADLERLLAAAANATRRVILGRLGDYTAAVVRRKRRDRERLHAYFAEVAQEMRRRPDRGGERQIAVRQAQIDAERAAKLDELEHRYKLRLKLAAAGLVVIDVPVRTVQLAVRRRKRERSIEVRYHPAVGGWEPLCCESCGTGTMSFSACDEAVHIICEECRGTSLTRGRWPCLRCDKVSAPSARFTSMSVKVKVGAAVSMVTERVTNTNTEPATRNPPPAEAPVSAALPSTASVEARAATAKLLARAEPAKPAFDLLVPKSSRRATILGSSGTAAPTPGQLVLPFDPETAVRCAIGAPPAPTAIEVAERAGLPVEVVRPILRRLVRSGAAVKEGNARGTRYRTAE